MKEFFLYVCSADVKKEEGKETVKTEEKESTEEKMEH